MSALAGILAERGFTVTGSDPRPSAILQALRGRGVRVFREQNASTISAIRSGTSHPPMVVISSAVAETNAELAEARRCNLQVWHRSDVLAALINSQASIAVAGSHGKTTTSTLIATLLAGTDHDPTAVIGGIVPAFGSNGRQGEGRLLVAEADESDGSLVKFHPSLGVITNLELDHTDHYPDLGSLISTLQRFAGSCQRRLVNHDDPVLREHFQADAWWSINQSEGVTYAALPVEERGDGTLADLYVKGSWVARLDIPLPGRHNLSNVVGALGACLMEGVSLAELEQAVTRLRPPGRRFDFRGLWRHRLIVDDYAHHPSEVSATLAMARLMVTSGQSPLPRSPQRLVAIFQPHRYSRTAEFLEGFAQALAAADLVLLAPLYAAGERPIAGISSEQLADTIRRLAPELMVEASASLDALAARLVEVTQPDDLVLAMGAGDVNSLWDRLPKDPDRDAEPPDVPIAA